MSLLLPTNIVRIIRWYTLETYVVAVLTQQTHLCFGQSACVFCREVSVLTF